MTRRKTTTIIHTPRRPVDKAQSVEQAIGPVPPLPPEVIDRARKVVLDHGADDLLPMLGLDQEEDQ